MKKQIKIVFTLLLAVILGFALIACKDKAPKREQIPANNKQNSSLTPWRTDGYVQGDFGNVPRLDPATGKAIMTDEIKNARQFEPMTINGSEKLLRTVFYYEVGDTNILNATTLTIGDTNIPFVDVVVIFAANINWDKTAEQPYLHLNYQVNSIIMNSEKYIKPLQEMGIKVLVDVLPNHQGVGFGNLRESDIEVFTDQLVELIDKYNFDGYDFDEEWAKYSQHPETPELQPNSMSNFLKRLREKLPNKIISVFDYALPSDMYERGTFLVENDVVDFAWCDYGYGAQTPPYLKGRQYYGSDSIIMNTSVRDEKERTKYSLENQYGFKMYFNVHNTVTQADSYKNYPEWFSATTQILYGLDVVWNGRFYKQDYGHNQND